MKQLIKRLLSATFSLVSCILPLLAEETSAHCKPHVQQVAPFSATNVSSSLTSLTIDGVDMLASLTSSEYTYCLPTYGTTKLPVVAATCSDGGVVEVTQATPATMQALVVLKDNAGGDTLATYVVHIVPALPQTTATYTLNTAKVPWNKDKNKFVMTDNEGFTVTNTGSYHEWFKIGNGGTYTISTPSNVSIGMLKVNGDQAQYQKVTSHDTCFVELTDKTHSMLLTNHQPGEDITLKNDLWGNAWVTFELATLDFKKVLPPTISLDELENGATVSMSCPMENVEIYYTTDGTPPTTYSNHYTGPFVKKSNGEIRAIAVAPQFYLQNSDEAIATIGNSKLKDGFIFTFTTGDYTSLTDTLGYACVRQAVSNTSFKLASQKGMYSDSRFKFGSEEFAILLPANAVVEKVEFSNLGAMYGGTLLWDHISSEGAEGITYAKTVSGDNTTVNFDGHKMGQPIFFQLKGGSPAFTGITVYYAIYNDGAINYSGSTAGDIMGASGCVELNFDREVTLLGSIQATVNGVPVHRTVAKGSTVEAYYWNLNHSANYTLTLPKGSVADAWGNVYDQDINVSFVTEASQPKANGYIYDYVVSTAEELKTALTEVAESNTTAESERKRILVKNGDYDLGDKTQTSVRGYNISIVGETSGGVRLFHRGGGGIVGDATISDESQELYMQDVIVEHASSLRDGNQRGVTVAFAGGNKAILKNVEMISGQDTYLTGNRTYLEDCTIHGTVDFICGGGDIFFNRTKLLVEGGGVITAGSHDASNDYGYVFRDCSVMPGTFFTAKDESYALGRPWKGEPRVAFINTDMQILAASNGWNGMSYCVTHFYEYGSVDKAGKNVDLSTRTVKDISSNKYVPVLDADSAATFDAYNVVGGKDGWQPALYTVQAEAPVVAYGNGNLSWANTEGANSYVIFRNGAYLANTEKTSYTIPDKGTYTVRAANYMGGLGEESNAVNVDSETGIDTIVVQQYGNTKEYNLLGQPISGTEKGVHITKGKKRVVR